MGYSGATYNLPEAPGGGYNLNYTLSKKYENKLNVGIRFDSEEIASLLINVTSNFKGKLPSTLSLTGRLGKRYTAGINYAWEPAPLKRVGLSYLFQYNDVNFYHYGDRTPYQEGSTTQQYSTDNEHFFSYFAQMEYETFDKAYFPSRGISARASYSLYTDNFTQYNDHAPFSAIKGYCEGVMRLGGDVPSRFLQQQLPFVGINNVELMDNSLLIGTIKFRQRMGSVHYVTLTGNYALSSHKVSGLLKEKTMFGCGVGYGLDSIFGPLEASINYANHADKVSMYVNLGFKF